MQSGVFAVFHSSLLKLHRCLLWMEGYIIADFTSRFRLESEKNSMRWMRTIDFDGYSQAVCLFPMRGGMFLLQLTETYVLTPTMADLSLDKWGWLGSSVSAVFVFFVLHMSHAAELQHCNNSASVCRWVQELLSGECKCGKVFCPRERIRMCGSFQRELWRVSEFDTETSAVFYHEVKDTEFAES